MHPVHKALGRACRRAREDAGTSRPGIADEAGTSVDSVIRWEQGRGSSAPRELDSLLRAYESRTDYAEIDLWREAVEDAAPTISRDEDGDLEEEVKSALEDFEADDPQTDAGGDR